VRGHRAKGKEIGGMKMGGIGGQKSRNTNTRKQRNKMAYLPYTFWQQAKAVRDGRAKWRGKREKYKNTGRERVPFPNNSRSANLVSLIPDSTLYGK
jgi:hypothetical protein